MKLCYIIPPNINEHLPSHISFQCMYIAFNSISSTPVTQKDFNIVFNPQHYDSQWLYFPPGDVAGQFTGAPPACPGDAFTFSCTVTGSMSGITIWRWTGAVSAPSHIYQLPLPQFVGQVMLSQQSLELVMEQVLLCSHQHWVALQTLHWMVCW